MVAQGSTSSAIESYSGGAAAAAPTPVGGIIPLAAVPNPFPVSTNPICHIFLSVLLCYHTHLHSAIHSYEVQLVLCLR